MTSLEELVEMRWGMRAPHAARQVRDDPYQRTWWMSTRDGPIMIKWFGDPDQRERAVAALRLLHWVAEQGAPISQVVPLRDGSVCLETDDGIFAVFEYVDGVVGVRDWSLLGHAVAALHTLSPPEFAERSPFSPQRALPEAHRSFLAFLNGPSDVELAAYARHALSLLRELPVSLPLPTGLIHTDIGIAHTLTRTTGEITFLETLDIGVGPLAMDFPPILCEHLSHLNAQGVPMRLNVDAARRFFEEYVRARPLTPEEHSLIPQVLRAYWVIRAARTLNQARRSGAGELFERARAAFRWLEYAEHIVPDALREVFGR